MKKKLNTLIRENRVFLLFLLLMLLFRSAVADWNDVPTGSMKPTILEGDRILVNKLAYDVRIPFTHISLLQLANPERGDIIVFDSEVSDKKLVKRVVGIPGDTLELSNNILTINGSQLDYTVLKSGDKETYALEDLFGVEHVIKVKNQGSHLSSFNAVTVPPGFYLVMGDNRDNSADSRVIGFVPRNEIVGRSRHVVLSLNYDNYFLPRSDRFLHALD